MAYSLTNTTKKSNSGSSSSSGKKAGQSITVTRSDREANRNGSSSGGSVSSGNTTSKTNTTGVTYDPNVDYAAEIQKAVQSGASQSYIDSLNAQRDAKIKGEGLNYSSLTSQDIENYRNTNKNYGFSGSYDSAGVLGSGGKNYGIKNPFDQDFSNFNSGVDFDERIAAAKASGADQSTIDGLMQMKEFTEQVRNGEKLPYGYGEGLGYSNRNTGFNFTLKDGSKVPVFNNATNYRDAARLAGIDPDDIVNTTALTYGTASSAYSKPGYGFGTIMGPSDFTTVLQNNDEDGRLYDMNNMQLQFLSGRDGMDYANPYAGYAYNGNGMTNAYNAGAQFAGQGGIMGAYGVEGPNMDDIYANYGNPDASFNSGYVGLTADDIQSQMNDVYDQYMDAIASRNAALTSYYDNQRAQLESQNEETQRANYVNYMLSQLNMPAQLQAAGINGGVAESTLAGLNSDYMTNYNNAANALTDAVTQLDIARQQAIAEGDMEAANMYSQLAQNSLSLQMQAAQAENAYNQWVQEMAFAQTQWEYEQARYNAELAYQQSLAAQEAERQDKENLIAYAQTVGDWDLYGSLTGTDTSYMSALQAAELADLYNTGSSSRSRSSGGSSGGSTGGNSYDTSINNLLGGTPSANGVTVTRKQGTVVPSNSGGTTLTMDFEPGLIWKYL